MTTALNQSVDRLIRGRRATRAFLPDEVPADTMRTVFELAGHAPSNSNTQPWCVEVVSGAARDRLADALVAAHAAGYQSVDFPYQEGQFRGVLATRRAQFGAQLYAALGIARHDTDLLDGTTPRVCVSTARRTWRCCLPRPRPKRALPPTWGCTPRRCCWQWRRTASRLARRHCSASTPTPCAPNSE